MQLRKEIKRGDFMSDITAVIDTLSDVADVLPTSGETRSRMDLKKYVVMFVVVALLYPIIGLVEYYIKVEDYHSLSRSNVVNEKLFNGTMDELYGPIASHDNGQMLYLVPVDNDKFIPFTSDKEEFKSYNEAGKKIKFIGQIRAMSYQEKSLSKKFLESQGFTRKQIEEILIPYTLSGIELDDITQIKFCHNLALLGALVGSLFFLPEYRDFLDRTNKNKNSNQTDNFRPSNYYPYNNRPTSPNERYSTYSDNRYTPQYTAQGQNRENK